MAKAIAKAYGVKLIEVLTGFKYIGEQIKFFEQQNSYEYVFGLEESYGCLAGTYARDKDACVAVMMLCEVAAWCKSTESPSGMPWFPCMRLTAITKKALRL